MPHIVSNNLSWWKMPVYFEHSASSCSLEQDGRPNSQKGSHFNFLWHVCVKDEWRERQEGCLSLSIIIPPLLLESTSSLSPNMHACAHAHTQHNTVLGTYNLYNFHIDILMRFESPILSRWHWLQHRLTIDKKKEVSCY